MRAVIVALLVLAPSLVLAQNVNLPPELNRVLRDYETAWRANDAAALARLFTKDGFVLPNFQPPARGRAAIQAGYAKSGGPLELHPLDFSADGSTGWIIGTFSNALHAPDSGKFVLALRKVDGRWLIAADIDNANSRLKPRPGHGTSRRPE